jgi:hypothetical protein
LRKLALVAGLLLCAPFVAVPQWSRTAINGEQTCVRDSGERFDVPADSRSWVTFGCNVLNAVETYLGVSLPKAFAQARIDPTAGDGINAENGNVLGPFWLEGASSEQLFEEGTGGSFDYAPYCRSPQGVATTVSTDTALPSGVTLTDGELTVSAMAADDTFEIELECAAADSGAAVALLVPVSIFVTVVDYREMGMGWPTPVSVTLNEGQAYSIIIGRHNTLFPSTLFQEQWTADLDGSGCGITPIDTTFTLEAWSGSGTTLGTGHDYYPVTPPSIAADCAVTFTLSNFVNDTTPAGTIVGAPGGFTTATINYIADEAPGSAVYFSNTAGLTPPTLSTPLTITTKAGMDAYDVSRSPGYGDTVVGNGKPFTGPGVVYEISNSGGDILIDLSGESAANAIRYPLHVSSCNDLVLRGVKFDFLEQADNGPGDLDGDNGGTNYGPRLAYGNLAIRTDCTGDVWIEGVWLEFNGHEGDNYVYRSAAAQPFQNQNIDVTIVNSRFRGREGGSLSPHSDFFQNQGSGGDPDVPKSVWIENVTDFNGQAGTTFHVLNGYRAAFTFKNYQAWQNAEYHIGGPNDGAGVFQSYFNNFDIMTGNTITGSYYKDTRGPTPWWVAFYNEGPDAAPQHYGPTGLASVPVASRLAGLTYGDPPTDMAPSDKVGFSYVSPWCDANPTASYCP